jgi:hypothetical protein
VTAFTDGISIETVVWRRLGAQMLPIVERQLACQGDHANPELIRLQHELATLLSLKPGDRMPESLKRPTR